MSFHRRNMDLFLAAQEGVTLYRIPGVVVTTQGAVLACCEARRNSKISLEWLPHEASQ